MKLQISLIVFVAVTCCSSWPVAEGTKGVDVSTNTANSTFSCLKQKGYEFVIVRAYRSNGYPDIAAAGSIRNANSAGFNNVDIYMFPCPRCPKTATQQVNEMVDSLNVNYGKIWLDIENTVDWYDVKQDNRNFFEQLLSTASKYKKTGVYVSKYQWEHIMGSGYTEGSSHDLWYSHYDTSASFSDFQPFGGWYSPTIKQYDLNKSECGAVVDLNYRQN